MFGRREGRKVPPGPNIRYKPVWFQGMNDKTSLFLENIINTRTSFISLLHDTDSLLLRKCARVIFNVHTFSL